MKSLPLQEEAGPTTTAKPTNFKSLLFHVGLVAVGVLLGTVLQYKQPSSSAPTLTEPSPAAALVSPLDTPHRNLVASRKLPNCPAPVFGECGGADGVPCPNGQCCSKFGYCGTTQAHCGNCCQNGCDGGSSNVFETADTESPPAPGNSNPPAHGRPAFADLTIDLNRAEPDIDATNEVLTDLIEEAEVYAEVELDVGGELLLTEAQTSELREGEYDNPTATTSEPTVDYDLRKLMMTHDRVGPLACNSDLATTSCTSFAALVANHDMATMLTIPCGECYTVDVTGGNSTLDFAGGILVRGKLHFPSTASLMIRTKFIFVAGVLKMDTPAVGNLVKITMYGDEIQSYENEVSTDLCGADNGGACSMGSKVIAVIGGELDIQGTESTCPSWEKLTGVGAGTVRPFTPPCHDSSDPSTCWDTDTFTVTGNCVHASGQSGTSGKYTVMCPIDANLPHVDGSSLGLKLTSVGTMPFDYPVANGVTLDLVVNGACTRAGHTDSLGKCTIYCPLKSTANVGSGTSSDLTFTSIKTPPVPYNMPAGLDLNIDSPCHNSGGHTGAWGRCVLRCKVKPTVGIGSGTGWSQLQMTSRYVEPPPPTVYNLPAGLSLTKNGNAYVSWGHTGNWGRCVVVGQVEPTLSTNSGDHNSPMVFTNNSTGSSYKASGILHWANGGNRMYTFATDYATTDCQQAADAWNSAFEVGDSMNDVTNYVEPPLEGFDGNTFLIDKIMHWSHASTWTYFFPTDKDAATCDATAADFQSKFKVGYNIDVGYPEGPPGGQEVAVDGVHHWAYSGNGMYFHPEASDVATCTETAANFTAKFPANYGIAVSHRSSAQIGEVVTASKGVHHWSWDGSALYFYPDDETSSSVSAKFPPGTQVQVTHNDDILDYQKVVVSPEAADCWSPGTEVLLTSHTRSQNDQQVAVIADSDATSGEITFDQPIHQPLSLEDHQDYAVEVASLNRRIVFDAEPDANDDKIGGHLIVFHTSTAQHIEGVEIRNFGQQGRLGKYPLHFHKCADAPDSLVKKNVVRDSNQRGYVVHLTNKVTLEENVAYDITGHCFFIEDGAETENVFRENLGTGIKVMPADRVALLSASSGRGETDGNENGFNGASVFWISNPNNFFYGNVAAGGQKNGYWFDTINDRMHMALGAFEDNEVHSSEQFAFTVYHPGWRPSDPQVIKNLKVYRNGNAGMFLHATTNVVFDGGLFADNSGKDVFISRGDNHVFNGTNFIGQTPFTSKQASCNGASGSKVGIHLDPFRFSETVLGDFSGNNKGTHLLNCQFSNFTSAVTGCGSDSRPLKFINHQTFVKAYNAPHYIENVQFDVPSQIDACMSGNSGDRFDDMSVEIVSDDHVALTVTGTAGFLVSPKLAPMNSCVAYNDCLKFCEGACLRTVTVVTGNAAFDDDLEMHVRRLSDDEEIVIEKEVRGHPNPAPVHNQYHAAYTVALPKAPAPGYELWFESASNPGVVQWPKYADAVYEATPSCSDYVVEGDLQFIKPTVRPECNELIHNGDFSGPPSWESEGWHAAYHYLDITETGGVNGTAAVATTTTLAGGSQPQQPLDPTCVEEGDVFEITFSFMSSTTASTLPSARIQVREISAGNNWQTTGWKNFASAASYQAGEWQTVTDLWTIDSVSANGDFLDFSIIGGDQMIVLDNVSITKVTGRRNLRAD